jgi:hypothetical protein
MVAVVRGIPDNGQPYLADGDFAAAQVTPYDEEFYASFGHMIKPFGDPDIVRFCLGGEPVCATGSRRDKSMTTASRPKAQAGVGTGI